MSKITYIPPGNGIIGPTGLEIRELLNNSFPAKEYYVPEIFNWSSMSAYADTVLVISYDHNLANANITMPANCTLLFKGGKLLTVGNIVGNNSRILNPDNLPCFNTVVAFTGTWTETICTYQWWGAKCDATDSTFGVDSADAINIAHASPFRVEPLPGFYYFTKTLIFPRAKHLELGISPFKFDGDALIVFNTVVGDHVEFYTDQDIDCFDIRTAGLSIKGGSINVKAVIPYTKDCIKIKAQTAKAFMGRLDMTVVGSDDSCQIEGASGKGFHFDASDNNTYGGMANWDIRLLILNIPYGLVLDSLDNAFGSTWVGVNRFEIYADGCKQGINIKSGFQSSLIGYTQTRNILAESEKNMYQAELGGDYDVKMFNWDLSSTNLEEPIGSGHFYPKNGTLVTSNGIRFIGYGQDLLSVTYQKNYEPKATRYITEKSRVRILGEKSNKDNFISDIHNSLTGFDRYGTISFKLHSGATIDFDDATPVIGSETELVDYTINYLSSLFAKGLYATHYALPAGSDIDKDFAEIHLSGTTFSGRGLHINLEGGYEIVKRMQFIGYKSTGNPEIQNVYLNTLGSYGRQKVTFKLTGSYTSIALRFIGVQDITKLIYINDIAIEQAVDYVSFPLKTDLPYATAEMKLTQSGTTAPTFGSRGKPLINTNDKTIALAYVSVGHYTVRCVDRIPKDSIDLSDETVTLVNGSTVRAYWYNTSQINIETKDSGGNFANGILTEQYLGWNRYY